MTTILGLTCISEQLKDKDKKEYSFRTMTRKRFNDLCNTEGRDEAIKELSNRILHNVVVTESIVGHCAKSNIGHYRVSSALFPLVTDETLGIDIEELPDIKQIQEELKKVGKESSFTKPSEFDLATFLSITRSAKKEMAVLRVRKNQGHALRSKYAVTEIDDEWDQMSLEYGFDQEIIQTILWYGSNVLVEKPEKLRSDIKSRLEELING